MPRGKIDDRKPRTRGASWGKAWTRVFGRKPPSSSTHQVAKTAAANNTNNGSDPLDLPIAIWMDHIFPLLHRAGKNALAAANPEIAVARRDRRHTSQLEWPAGKIAERFSRPVKQLTFLPGDNEVESSERNNQQVQDTTLLVAYCKPKVVSYNILTGPTRTPFMDPSATPHAHKGIVADIKVCPVDSSLLATASKNDGTIRLWKLSPGTSVQYTCMRILQVHQHDLRHMEWSPRGDKIVSWGLDGFLRVSSVTDGAMTSRFWKTRIEVAGCHRSVAFDPTGTVVAFAWNNERVYLWDLKTDQISPLLGGGSWDEHGCYAGAYVGGVAYCPNARLLVVGCHVALLKVWLLTAPVNAIDVNAEDDQDSRQDPSTPDHFEYVFDRDIHLGGGWSAVTLLTFEPSGRFLACTNNGCQIRVVDLVRNEVIATFKGHTGRIESLCFTSNGKTLASGACDRTVRFWDMSNL